MAQHKDSEIRLGRLELQIMNVVWERGNATVHDVKDAISKGRKPAYSTILTMMRKLEAKGYLEHAVRDRTYVYRAVISRQQAEHGLIGELVERLFGGSASLLVSSLVEQNRVSEKELHEIQELIKKRREQNE
ncbi:MAG: BlaI/MecI/CopY family transcriptional regulator [Planctomycetota bacterium]|jgi:predicted transcriptional regulator